MPKHYLFYGSERYTQAIIRPIEAAIRARGDEVAWFFGGPGAEDLTPQDKLLTTVEAVKAWNPIAVITPNNLVPHFFPGVKVQTFHGFDAGKPRHIYIRGLFDLYCTTGPRDYPPAIAADANSRPFIANYWSAKPGEAPRYRVVTPDGDRWQVLDGPKTAADFSLSGIGTKRPPISRSVLLIKKQPDASLVHLIYRDDHQGEKVILATAALPAGKTVNALRWQQRPLTDFSVGAWEPSFDPQQWHLNSQAHLPVQQVEQLDGSDHQAAETAPKPFSLLMVNP